MSIESEPVEVITPPRIVNYLEDYGLTILTERRLDLDREFPVGVDNNKPKEEK